MKPLKRINSVKLYHYVNGEKIMGDCSGLRGNCSGLWGDCSDLRGDCSDLSGDCSGLSGDCDIIPLHERKEHPDVLYWVEEST